jgi:hypothetical protein
MSTSDNDFDMVKWLQERSIIEPELKSACEGLLRLMEERKRDQVKYQDTMYYLSSAAAYYAEAAEALQIAVKEGEEDCGFGRMGVFTRFGVEAGRARVAWVDARNKLTMASQAWEKAEQAKAEADKGLW